ncbi:MAG: alpha/beta hydrolase [Paracoccaceae bacterium]|nr:alpha/beta hydrolase [Paracoccaceae bacterium]
MVYLVSIAGVAVVMLAIWPFYQERRRPVIGLKERHGAKGEFLQLSQGVTYCRWAGAARGPVAVVVHGIATPMISMNAVAKGLGDLGYRVLIYDLYGRGLSDAPKGAQDRTFFLRQLADLCAYHRLTEDITVVGYSMGGAIATAFAVEYPHSVKRVIMIAGSGVVMSESRFTRYCRRAPIIGDWLHGVFAHDLMLKAIPEKGETKEIDYVFRAQRRALDYRGYLPAILSSRRGMLAETQQQDHQKLGRQGISVIAIWAARDQIIPLRALGVLAQWNRSARQEVVEDADHGLPFTHGSQVVDAIRSALRD